MKIQLKSILKVAMFASILPISGCGLRGPLTPEAAYKSTTISHDPYQNSTWISGERFSFSLAQYASMRALAKGKTVIFYQLYVETYEPPNSTWAFYNDAYTRGGNMLEFTPINREVENSGGTREIFGIQLSREQLNAAKESGIDIQAVGKNQNLIISMPAAYFIGFLQKVDDYKKH